MSRGSAIAIHGDVGDDSKPKSPDQKMKYEEGLRIALLAGRRVLEKGGSSLDAVEEAIRQLEDSRCSMQAVGQLTCRTARTGWTHRL